MFVRALTACASCQLIRGRWTTGNNRGHNEDETPFFTNRTYIVHANVTNAAKGISSVYTGFAYAPSVVGWGKFSYQHAAVCIRSISTAWLQEGNSIAPAAECIRMLLARLHHQSVVAARPCK